MKKILGLLFMVSSGFAQSVTLSSSPYTQNFDAIGIALPNGWSIRLNASSSALGAEQVFSSIVKSWGESTGGFKNFASATGLSSGSSSTIQGNSTNRALGIRQTGSVGDPGAAFVLKLENTLNAENIQLSFLLQSLNANSPRTTTWTVDAGVGESPSNFTTLSSSPALLQTGNTTFNSTTVMVSLPSSFDNLPEPVYIRILSTTASAGAGARASTGIDDFTLSFDPYSNTDPLIQTIGSLSAFVTPEGQPSPSQFFRVLGQNLSQDLVVTAAAGYAVSLAENGTYSTSVSLSPSSGSVPITPIYVRLLGTTAGTFSGNIGLSSTGALNKNIPVTGTVNPPLGVSTPISQVRLLAEGNTVTVAGRATVGEQFGGFQFFLQDSSAGISIFKFGVNLIQENGIEIGDSVQVQGVLGSFNGLKQINVTAIAKIAGNKRMVEPKLISPVDILEKEGSLVRINDVSTPNATFVSQTNYFFDPVQVRITQQTNSAGFVNPLVGVSISGGSGYVIGIAGRFNNSPQLLPRLLTDVVRTGDPIPGRTDVSYATDSTLEVVTWNLEWFGADNGPADNALQRANAKHVFKTINADLYLLQEVSNLPEFNSLVSELNGYAGVCGTELSQDNNAPDGQRVCFLYRTAVFSNITTKHLLTSIKANPSLIPDFPDSLKTRFWASGRLPFTMQADVSLPGRTSQNLLFVGIHARANGSTDALGRYNMRKYDVELLKDTLDTYYPTTAFIMAGDFNDDLDFTVASGVSTSISSYNAYINDTSRYTLPTLSLSLLGQKSTIGFGDMIDHILTSNELKSNYISGTARVSNVEQYITSYGSTTSDHYPVMAKFTLGTKIPCPINLPILSLVENQNVDFSASASSGGKIQASNRILGNSRVNYSASTMEFLPGFETQKGVVFSAQVGGCPNF